MTEFQYEMIVDELYRYGKADVTAYAANTEYDIDDNDFEED